MLFGRLFKFLLILSLVSILLNQYSCKAGPNFVRKKQAKEDTLAKFPYWIAMMDSPGINYSKAVNAFEKYWEFREKPTEDDGEGKDIYGKTKSAEEKEKEAKRSIEYVYEYKQFLNWMERNKNLVKPDGTVMTPEDILNQWKQLNDTLRR